MLTIAIGKQVMIDCEFKKISYGVKVYTNVGKFLNFNKL
jgi:hypothetical protein